jgi:nicotinamide-nucleotide amidase
MAQAEHSVASEVGERIAARDQTLAVAESLTGGELSARFATVQGSSDWYRGGVVAYSSAVKHELLSVPEGPVVSEVAVRAMAEHVVQVLGAEVGLAVSGVAGPDEQDGQPPGTVWMAAYLDGRTCANLEQFTGDPEDVVDATLERATGWLLELLAASS